MGLTREPFVAGVPDMIERATRDIPHAEEGFLAVFSAGYFPDARIVLEWAREDGGGNVYRWKEKEMEGWLCPALLKYFDTAPAELYARAEPKSR